jgi:ribosomal protein L16 Arg81 hydroxylase
MGQGASKGGKPPLDMNMLTVMIQQMVQQQIMQFMSQFIQQVNELSMSNHTSLSMMEVMRRVLEEKGIVSKPEFEEMADKMSAMTKRAMEIANDSDTPEDDRVRMMLEECNIEEGTARDLIKHAAENPAPQPAPPEPEEGEEDEQPEQAETPAKSG